MSAIQIQQIVAERNIRRLVHFTPAQNLHSISQNGILSVEAAASANIPITQNDNERFDGHPNAISLSVSLPNYKMFYKCRVRDRLVDWAVVTLDVRLLWELDCSFYPTNAANAAMSCIHPSSLKCADSFAALFEDNDLRKNQTLFKKDTTDVQAEVLVFETISPDYITGMYFDRNSTRVKYPPVFKKISPKVASALFSKREFVRNKQVRQANG
ncbi:hypothetical protein PsAD13_00255 [Pseudovibrio sp. Ad13]|uniref:DarT ssDNA thymidine ADP-ribosyltransferase family protein n=1 Tax=Pseudovibrio sp. Ad13 TaxID=989396 RepID=UPI0007AE6748|nr:DarT ssDNA thymidine ADP-ribosyltransferase family protein [Pseudovibrio sp. Ad13]KZK86988.1 hypothetical protein PsAD13_00255 [Pseudovibrio sp. Ad13]